MINELFVQGNHCISIKLVKKYTFKKYFIVFYLFYETICNDLTNYFFKETVAFPVNGYKMDGPTVWTEVMKATPETEIRVSLNNLFAFNVQGLYFLLVLFVENQEWVLHLNASKTSWGPRELVTIVFLITSIYLELLSMIK